MNETITNEQTLEAVDEPIAAGDSIYFFTDNMPQPLRLRCFVNNKEMFAVSVDGKVTLSPDLDLSDVQRLGLPYLLALREFINTAIYDKEQNK